MTAPDAIVIGGTRGIGRAVALELAAGGGTVAVVGRTVPDGLPEQVRVVVADVREGEALRAVLDRLCPDMGRRVVVLLQRYREGTDTWNGELAVTLTATRTVLDTLRDRLAPGSAIVAVSSLASTFVVENQDVAYHVAKAGLNQLMRYYAVVLGARGIRVNCVTPGCVLKDEAAEYYAAHRELHDAVVSATPLQRLARPVDIAKAVAFLCSEAAAFITGQNLVVDGGLSLIWQESLARRAVTELHPKP